MLGVVALFFGCLWMLSIPFGIAGIVFAVVGMRQTMIQWVSWIGIGLCSLAISWGLVIIGIFILVDRANASLRAHEHEQPQPVVEQSAPSTYPESTPDTTQQPYGQAPQGSYMPPDTGMSQSPDSGAPQGPDTGTPSGPDSTVPSTPDTAPSGVPDTSGTQTSGSPQDSAGSQTSG